jgi:hypothetical protein
MTNIFTLPEEGTTATNLKGILFAEEVRQKSIQVIADFENECPRFTAELYEDVFQALKNVHGSKFWALEYAFNPMTGKLDHVQWLSTETEEAAS